MSFIKNVPAWVFRKFKRGFDRLRALLFTVDAKDRDIAIHAQVGVDELQDAFGDAHFTNGWELSYNYKGEDMNMRRPLRKDDKYEWYQTHVRGFEQDDGTVKLELHEDLEPTEHPYYHLHPPSDSNLSEQNAIDHARAVLDDAGISYTVL